MDRYLCTNPRGDYPHRLAKAFAEMSDGLSQLVNGMRYFVVTASELIADICRSPAFTLMLLQMQGRSYAPRVAHLAYYAKKKRVRKKNLNRLKKILQERLKNEV